MLQDIATISLEGSAVLLLVVITYKVYKMRIHTSSHCCGDAVNIETDNEGGDDMNNLV